MSKPSIPKGTRDFSASEMAKRNYILDTIKKYFRLYGFEQIETPAMENLTTLTGKYGEEGDQLLFKILNSRIHESREKDKLLEEFTKSLESPRNTPVLTERALRYDLTVPFARYVVQHQHEITFPFKRFQIQPVWRADKPQKGRYREFYQCDADMIGSDSLVNELELVRLMDDVYNELNIPVTIKINNRKILKSLSIQYGAENKFNNILEAFDKLEKIGHREVEQELINAGLTPSQAGAIISYTGTFLPTPHYSTEDRFAQADYLSGNNDVGEIGIKELRLIFDFFKANPLKKAQLEFDGTLARGLNYYTGAIFEVKVDAGSFKPSITGGGRYDDLTGIFGLPNVSGVGVSFGVDRIYDVMEELNLFPADKLNLQSTQLLLMHMGEGEQQHGLQMLTELRKAGIRTEIYPDITKKMNKQFDYATKKNIPYAIVIGSNEMASKKYTLKTKDEKFPDMALDQLIEQIKKGGS